MTRRSPLVPAIATVALVVFVTAAVARLATERSASVPARSPQLAISVARKPLVGPFVMFRTLAPRHAFGRIAMASPAHPSRRQLTPISCARVQYAAGTGLCLVEEPDGKIVRQVLYLFDAAFRQRMRLELKGVPIRARVSPDGRLASVTTYGEEESPAGERLASESILIDAASGRVLGDLRSFSMSSTGDRPIVEPIDIEGDRDLDHARTTAWRRQGELDRLRGTRLAEHEPLWRRGVDAQHGARAHRQHGHPHPLRAVGPLGQA